MPQATDPTMFCTFCRRDHHTVPSLVAGPGVFICGDCVTLATKAIRREEIPDFPGWSALGDDALLDSLVPAQAAADATTGAVGELVGELRRRDVSWSRIGAALGVSRQAAWERYASLT